MRRNIDDQTKVKHCFDASCETIPNQGKLFNRCDPKMGEKGQPNQNIVKHQGNQVFEWRNIWVS